MAPLRRALPLLLLIVVVAVFFLLRLDRVLAFDRLLDNRATLRDAVDRQGFWALAAYMGSYVAVAALSVPGGLLLTLTGGFLFGTLAGGLAAAVSASLGATAIFLAARSFLNDFLSRKAGTAVDRIRRGVQQSAWSYMLFLRLSPVFPFWLVNIGAACAGVPLLIFVVSTALGILPVTFVVASAGANLDRIAAASQATRDACRAEGGADCGAAFPWREVLSPTIVALLVAASLLALTPAAIRALKARREGRRERRREGCGKP